MLNAEEKQIVLKLAKGEKVAREVVEKIYRRHSGEFKQGRPVVEVNFMYECLNVCPDLALRAKYRREIIQGAN